VDRETTNAPPDLSTDLASGNEVQGSVLDVVAALLGDFGERDVVLQIVRKLVADNSDMARRLSRIAARFKKSERVGKAQLVLFLDALQRGEGEPETDEPPDEIDAADDKLRTASGIDGEDPDDDLAALKTRPPRQPHSRTPAAAHLPRVENPIAVPPEQRACPTCGAERMCIGHDVTEVIERIPAQVIVRRDAREKLACPPCDGEIVRAPLGDKVVPGGKLGPGLVVQMLVDKYIDGLPLHRQRERFARLGLDISVSTLCDQVKWCTDLLRPLWRAALAEVIAARVMHLDATGLPVLDSSASGGKRIGALWGYVGVNATDTIAAYLYCSTGKKTAQRPNEMGPEEMLSLRDGLTVADASNAFDASFLREELIECGCNMHARRYFVKALDAGVNGRRFPS